MKRIYSMIAAFAAIMCCNTLKAQENKTFAVVGLGVQCSEMRYDGAGFSVEAGHNFKGLEVSAQMSYYSISWGSDWDGLVGFVLTQDQIKPSWSVLEWNTAIALRLNIGYDVLRFVKGNWHHHIKPFLGLGYAQERYVRNDATHYIEGYSFRHNESVASGFGVMLGISYDYSITEHWSMGVLYERGLNICEHNIFGVHARYSF